MSKIVVAARQSVESQLHVGKQPTKNQAVKNDPAKDLALPNSKKRWKGHGMEKESRWKENRPTV